MTLEASGKGETSLRHRGGMAITLRMRAPILPTDIRSHGQLLRPKILLPIRLFRPQRSSPLIGQNRTDTTRAKCALNRVTSAFFSVHVLLLWPSDEVDRKRDLDG